MIHMIVNAKFLVDLGGSRSLKSRKTRRDVLIKFKQMVFLDFDIFWNTNLVICENNGLSAEMRSLDSPSDLTWYASNGAHGRRLIV